MQFGLYFVSTYPIPLTPFSTEASRQKEHDQQTHVQERVEERPREPLLEAHHGRLQLPAGHSSPSPGTTAAKLGAAVPEVVGDGAAAAGREPLRPSLPRPGARP